MSVHFRPRNYRAQHEPPTTEMGILSQLPAAQLPAFSPCPLRSSCRAIADGKFALDRLSG